MEHLNLSILIVTFKYYELDLYLWFLKIVILKQKAILKLIFSSNPPLWHFKTLNIFSSEENIWTIILPVPDVLSLVYFRVVKNKLIQLY